MAVPKDVSKSPMRQDSLTQAEIESVGYQWAPVNDVIAEYNPETLIDGFNDDGFFYISEPGQGLWALRSRFGRRGL